jgi:TnpA family transposase
MSYTAALLNNGSSEARMEWLRANVDWSEEQEEKRNLRPKRQLRPNKARVWAKGTVCPLCLKGMRSKGYYAGYKRYYCRFCNKTFHLQD